MKTCFVALLFVFIGPVTAEPLRVVTGEFAPFTGENLDHGGPFTKRVMQIFELAQVPARVDFRPWKRGYLETLGGTYIATFPYSKNQERMEIFHYSDPVIYGNIHLYANNESGIAGFTGFSDLKGKEVCLPVGYNLYEPLEQAVEAKEVTVLRVASLQQCFDMVAKGRTDLTMVRLEVAEEIFRERFPEDNPINVLYPSVLTFTEHVIFPKNSPQSAALLMRFNEAMAQLDSQQQ